MPNLAPNGFANLTAAAPAGADAGTGHPCTTNDTNFAPPDIPNAATGENPICITVSTGSGEAKRILAAFVSKDASVLNSASY